MKIGIMDSGIGGMNTYLELVKKGYGNDLVFLADEECLPYGNKSVDFLCNRLEKIFCFFESQQISLLIVACNTASSVLKYMDLTKYSFQIQDVIGPTVEKALEDSTRKYAIWGTNRTISSLSYQQKIPQSFGIAFQEAVTMIEEDIHSKKLSEAVQEKLEETKDYQGLILGCTHFSLLTNQIREVRPDLKLLDSSKIVVEKLPQKNTLNNKTKICYTTKENTNLQDKIKHIFSLDVLVKVVHL